MNDQLTQEVLKELGNLKKRDNVDLHCTAEDFEVLFIASLLEEESPNVSK